MAKHITEQDVEKIISVITGWDGKLTWDALCEAVEPQIGTRPTRPTLYSKGDIRKAFEDKKKQQKHGVKNTKTPQSLALAGQRIARLENELVRVKAENARLLEQFVTWQYNAYRHGMSEAKLNEPLPQIDRESSED